MAGEVVPLKQPSADADKETKRKERLLKWRNDITERVLKAVREDIALQFLDSVDDEESLDLKGEFNPIVDEKTGDRLTDAVAEFAEEIKYPEKMLWRLYKITDDDGSNFHGQLRKNDTHQSTTDLEAKLYRKADGREAKLAYLGHALMENRNGLAVGGMVTQADGTAERRASEAMLKKQAKGSKRITVGEDKAYDTSDHIAALRRMNVTPHVAQNDSLTKTGKRRRSAIDARTTRHIGYQISQTCRKMAECIFGWGKQHGTMRKTKHRGTAAVAADFMLNLIAYNLMRIPKLIAA